MTAREMQITFQQIYESHAGYNLTPLLTDDIQYYLNEAQDKMFMERFVRFEQNQVVTDELKPFVIKELVIPTQYIVPTFQTTNEIDSAPFAADHRYLLNHKSEVLVANSGGVFDFEVDAGPPIKRIANTAPAFIDFTTQVARNHVSQHDDILILLEDPFNKTIATEPLVTISQDGINVYTNTNFIVDNVVIDYIKEPTEIDLTTPTPSEFPVFLHRDLVELAVNLYLQFQLEPS